MSDETPYDQIPFSSYPSPERHPDRLATIAHLFGHNSAAIEKSKILELGCSNGSNLIAIAETFPKAACTGIDRSEKQIAAGQRAVAELELRNIELRCQHLESFASENIKYDYIFCHGLFSWVPVNVQHKIIEIISNHLSPAGVALISYNCLPGWQLRGNIRAILQQLDIKTASAESRVNAVRQNLDRLMQEELQVHALQGLLVREELANLREQSDAYLFHELLAETNIPLSITDFNMFLKDSDLQYLGDSSFAKIRFGQLTNFPEMEIISQEYLADLLFPITLRSTLLCRKNVILNRAVAVSRLRDCYYTSFLAPSDDGQSFKEGDPIEFKNHLDYKVQVTDPLLINALMRLCKLRPLSINGGELIKHARKDMGQTISAEQELNFFSTLLGYFSLGLVEININPARFQTSVAKKPKTSKLARWQAVRQSWVTNFRNEYAPLNEFERRVVALADGKLTQEEILRQLNEDSKLTTERKTTGILTEELDSDMPIEQKLSECIHILASCALLL